MRLGFAEVFSDAAAQWRSDQEMLFTVAAAFLFLPALGFGMLITDVTPVARDAPPEVMWAALDAFFRANWPWYLGAAVLQEFGSLAMMVLMLDASRPTVGQALARALPLLPLYLLAMILSGLLIGFGFSLLIVPGVYLMGRLFLVAPALAAEPRRGPLGAIEASVRLSGGHGWLLAAIWLVVAVTAFVLSGLVPAQNPAGVAGVVAITVDLVSRLLLAGLGTAASVAALLLRVAAYRRLGPARQGI